MPVFVSGWVCLGGIKNGSSSPAVLRKLRVHEEIHDRKKIHFSIGQIGTVFQESKYHLFKGILLESYMYVNAY